MPLHKFGADFKRHLKSASRTVGHAALLHLHAQEERGRRSLDRAVDGTHKRYLEVLEIVTPQQIKGGSGDFHSSSSENLAA